MESPLISRKRVFPGENSMDPDVIEIAPPLNRTSKSKSVKHKEVVNQEIIDVDMDEDSDNVILNGGKVHKLNKGKEAIAANSGYIDGDKSEHNCPPGSYDVVNLDGFGSDLSYVDDEYLDMYHDSMHVFNDNQMYEDDYATLQSHFDNIDIPPGVEAPVPWFPGPGKGKTTADTISSNHSFLQPQAEPWGVMPVTESSNSQWSAEPLWKKSSSTTQVHAVTLPQKGEMYSSWSSTGPASKYSDKHGAQGLHKSTFSSAASSHGPKIPSGPIEQYHGPTYGSAHFHNNNKRKVGSSSFVSDSYMHTASGAYPGPATTNLFNYDINQYHMGSADNPMFFDPYMTDYMLPEDADYFVHDSSRIQKNATHFGTPSKSSSRSQKNLKGLEVPSESSSRSQKNSTKKDVNEDEILHKFQQFKKFDMVQDPSDHHYVNYGFPGKQPPKSWSKKIQEEWKILEKDLPDTIFVRVYESRMDLLRAVIVGAEGTPYHDGLFFFDVFFPDNYPSVPPHVFYHSRGLRLNPNLYDSGKVCLSLLNTWSGSKKEMWIPKLSTMLQVLVSIQGLILNAKPYFNEPGYANSSGTVQGERSSQQYNESTFILSLRTMVYTLRGQPKHFEDFVVGHFFKHARDILVACKAYMDGAQVGCLVKGGVQDVDEGDKSCSEYFKGSVGQYIKPLVDEFVKIGVKDCEQFIPTAQTGNIVTGNRQIRHRLMSTALKAVNYFP